MYNITFQCNRVRHCPTYGILKDQDINHLRVLWAPDPRLVSHVIPMVGINDSEFCSSCGDSKRGQVTLTLETIRSGCIVFSEIAQQVECGGGG